MRMPMAPAVQLPWSATRPEAAPTSRAECDSCFSPSLRRLQASVEQLEAVQIAARSPRPILTTFDHDARWSAVTKRGFSRMPPALACVEVPLLLVLRALTVVDDGRTRATTARLVPPRGRDALSER